MIRNPEDGQPTIIRPLTEKEARTRKLSMRRFAENNYWEYRRGETWTKVQEESEVPSLPQLSFESMLVQGQHVGELAHAYSDTQEIERAFDQGVYKKKIFLLAGLSPRDITITKVNHQPQLKILVGGELLSASSKYTNTSSDYRQGVEIFTGTEELEILLHRLMTATPGQSNLLSVYFGAVSQADAGVQIDGARPYSLDFEVQTAVRTASMLFTELGYTQGRELFIWQDAMNAFVQNKQGQEFPVIKGLLQAIQQGSLAPQIEHI